MLKLSGAAGHLSSGCSRFSSQVFQLILSHNLLLLFFDWYVNECQVESKSTQNDLGSASIYFSIPCSYWEHVAEKWLHHCWKFRERFLHLTSYLGKQFWQGSTHLFDRVICQVLYSRQLFVSVHDHTLNAAQSFRVPFGTFSSNHLSIISQHSKHIRIQNLRLFWPILSSFCVNQYSFCTT